jgi:hypothetical protein
MTENLNVITFTLKTVQTGQESHANILFCLLCRSEIDIVKYLVASSAARATLLEHIQHVQDETQEDINILHPLFTVPIACYSGVSGMKIHQLLRKRLEILVGITGALTVSPCTFPYQQQVMLPYSAKLGIYSTANKGPFLHQYSHTTTPQQNYV